MYKCPECGSDVLDVAITTWARLHQDSEGEVSGTCPDEADQCDHEWGDESLMHCHDCDHDGPAKKFEAIEDEEDDDADAGE